MYESPTIAPIDFAQQRMEVVNRLAAGVAHEFNNVLQIVRGYVAFARDSLPCSCDARDDLEKALIATDRAADLSRRLLQFARAEENDSGRADPSDAIDALRLLLRPIIGENIRVECATSPATPLALADDAALRQALLNLCVNARDAMPRGGVLTLRCDAVDSPVDDRVVVGQLRPERYVLVSVGDSGTGIAPDLLDSVFEPFFSTKPTGEGTGLGLPMVAAFTRGAGGAVAVRSEVDLGTEVRLYLPAAADDAARSGDDAA